MIREPTFKLSLCLSCFILDLVGLLLPVRFEPRQNFSLWLADKFVPGVLEALAVQSENTFSGEGPVCCCFQLFHLQQFHTPAKKEYFSTLTIDKCVLKTFLFLSFLVQQPTIRGFNYAAALINLPTSGSALAADHWGEFSSKHLPSEISANQWGRIKAHEAGCIWRNPLPPACDHQEFCLGTCWNLESMQYLVLDQWLDSLKWI